MPTILVVDDDEIILELIRNAFRSEDYTLVMTQDGEDALAKARDMEPDL